MTDKIVLEEIRAARKGVAEAENVLVGLLSEVKVAPRAEKTTISEALHDAFEKLRGAREHLGKLETLLLRGKDD
jgi:hypothetical protein